VIYEIEEKPNILTFSGLRDWVSDVLWHPTNTNTLISCSYEGGISVYDIRSTFPLHSVAGVHHGKAFCECWKNENELLTGTKLMKD